MNPKIANNDDEIEVEFLPYIRVYKSGRVERLQGTEIVAAGVDPATGVTSKDVTIDATAGVTARLFLPDCPGRESRLPVLVYYHGGAFAIESPFSPHYHAYANDIAARAGLLVVSVHYRLAPEHPLPAAYDDGMAALAWAASASDAWLADRADLGRVFLAGDSAGANIAHQTALRSGSGSGRGRNGLGLGLGIEGLVLVHPYFWGADPVGSEARDPGLRAWMAALWRFVCPSTAGDDDAWINPLAGGAEALAEAMRGCNRVMVCVAGMDLLRERGRVYWEALRAGGVEAELVESEGKEHVFHLDDPTWEEAVKLMECMVAFFNR